MSSSVTSLLVAAALALGAGCGGHVEADPDVLVIEESMQTASFILNFNPLLEAGDVLWPARHAMYEPLQIFEPLRGAYVPWLAERYTWIDGGKRLRFDLRPGVRWSDGLPFTADDVVFTFELLKKFPALDGRGVWGYVADIRAIDPRTVELTMQRVYTPGLFHISQQPIVPAHVWSKVKDPVSWPNTRPVATGPFTELESYGTQSYQVGRNPYYWQPGKPAVRSIRFMALPSNDQTALALLRGEIDWAGTFLPAVERIYTSNPDHHYWFPPIDGTVLVYPNTRKKPLDDPRVRKAISMAIDRELVVKVAMFNYTRPSDATALSDAYARFRSADAVSRGDWVRHDPAAAEKLLDDAGLKRGPDGMRRTPEGKPVQFTIGVPVGFTDWVRAAQVVTRGMRRIGIGARVDSSDFNAWYEHLQQGDFDLSMGWTEIHPSPYGLYRHLMGSETLRPIGEMAVENWHRFGLPAADRILTEIEATTEPAREHELVVQLQQLFVDHAPAIPLFPGPLWGEYSSKRFTGFPNADNPYAPLSPHWIPQSLLVLTELKPR